MNKTTVIIMVCAGLLILAGIGYAVWGSYNPPQVAYNTQNQTATTTTTSVTATQPSSPTVQTNSSTEPYISTVVVSGTVNPNGAPAIYWFEYGETTLLGAKTSAYSIGSGYATFYTPAYITGLSSNTNYYFRLVASNSIGLVSGATYSFKTDTTPSPSGTAPTANTNSASNIARTAANLNGQINPKNSATTYWFEYGLTSNLGTVTSFQTSENNNSPANVSASVSGLQALTKYYFRLNAQNQFGTVNGQILNFTTQGPSAATSPTAKTNSATSVTSNSAKLNASVNSDGAITTYWFEYSNNALLSNISVISTTRQTLDIGASAINVFANVNNLNNNTKYYFRSVAQSQYGTVRGDILSFTTRR